MQSTNTIDKWLKNNSFDVSDFSNYTELYLLKIKKKTNHIGNYTYVRGRKNNRQYTKYINI